MTESAASFAAFGFASRAGVPSPGRGRDVLAGGLAVYQTYECSDGRYVSLASLEPKFWKAFCAASGFEGTLEALQPGPHQDALRGELTTLFRSRTRDAWAALGAAHDCCLEPVLEPVEVLEDAQLKARALLSPDMRRMATPTAPSSTAPAPAQGQHTDEILREAGIRTP